jgi:predicted NUDIX family NTP pyrophosphohydrolase
MPDQSAGILLYRLRPDSETELLLVHPGGPYWKNKDEHAWSIPKGEYRSGEDPERAAEREFAEELGQAVPTGTRIDLGEIRQSGGKRVRVWAVCAQEFSIEQVVSNEFEIEWPPSSGRLVSFPEVDRAEWTGAERARRLLVRGQVAFIDRLLEQIAPRIEPGTG